MSVVIDIFAGFGLVALVALIAAVTVTAAKIRRANTKVAGLLTEQHRAYVASAVRPPADKPTTPSPYTIPKGPST